MAGSYTLTVIALADSDGTPLATFESDSGGGDTRPKASIGRVSWVLNQPGSMTFTAPIDLPATATVGLLTTEVELYRDAELIWRGIPVQRERSGGAVVFTCAGMLWPFTRWYVGPNTNDFVSGRLNFENGLVGWTTVGTTATIVTSPNREGLQAAMLTNAGADEDSYIQTTFLATTSSIGGYYEVTAEYFISGATPWIGPAFEERGLYVESTGSLPDGTGSWEPINNASPRQEWTRVTTGISLPPNLTNHEVRVRLYSPGGAIAWDNGTVKRQESISAMPTGTDAAVMFGLLVDYCFAQKFDLQLGTIFPAAGVEINDVYQYFELPNVFDIMESFPARGLLDFGVKDRIFTAYSPRRGTYKPAKALTVTPDTVPPIITVLSYGHRADGTSTVSRVIRTGAGTGATRDVYDLYDVDLTAGMFLEDVVAVPLRYGPNAMQALAAQDLARLRDVVTIPSARVPAEGWLGVLEEGDTTDVTIADGAVSETSVRRVLAVDLDPRSDTVTYQLADEAEVP